LKKKIARKGHPDARQQAYIDAHNRAQGPALKAKRKALLAAEKKVRVQFCPPGKSGNPNLKRRTPKSHRRRGSPFVQGGLPDTNRRRH
jgi:hypothetical protein